MSTSTRPPRGLASARDRFQTRATQARRRPWLLAGRAVVVVAAVALLVWLVAFSPVLAVRSVEVVGVPKAEVEPIRRLAAVAPGTPLARVDGGAVADRVRQRATLADVSIERAWPGTLVIHASPRVPVLVVENPQGQLNVVDANGVAYADVRTAPKGVPRVRAASTEGLSREALRTALSVVAVLPAPVKRQVSDITVSGAAMVTLRIGGTTVVWGGMAEPEKKRAVVQALLPTRPAVIDVSAPDTPVTR